MLTKEEVKKEIIKCGKSPQYFINSYIFISHPIKGRVLFKTFQYQDDLLKSFLNYRFNIILKARQIGASEIVRAYCIWLILFQREKEILIISTKQDTSNKFVKKAKKMYDLLPDWLKIAKDKINNRTTIELSNGSSMWAGSTAVDAGRSDALSLLVIDEAAHIEGMEELWTSAKPTLSTGGSCIALSSPLGVDNWFYKTYSDAETQTNNFHSTKLMWDVREDRDEKWVERETKGWDKRKVAQEYLCDFLTSGITVIDPDDIKQIEENDIVEPESKRGFDRNYYVWKEYNPGHNYLLIADVARGDGFDFSAFIIIDLKEKEQVAEYKGKPDPEMFAKLLNLVGKEYRDCLLAVENNTYGYSVLTKLIDMEYPNLYYSEKTTHEYVESIQAESRSDVVPGFATTNKTRSLIIAKLEEFIRNRIFVIRSKRLLSEMKTFIWKNGRPDAQRGHNDDLLMCLAIACWVHDVAIVKNTRDVEYKKALLNAMIKTSVKMDTTIEGMKEHRKEYKNNVEPIDGQEIFWIYSR